MTQSTPTDREADVYAEVFVSTGIKTAAFRAAFPKSSASKTSVNRMAVRVHDDIKVLSRIEKLQKSAVESVSEEFTVTISDRKKILARVAQMGFNKKSPALGAVVSAVNELNRMDGSHAAQKIAGHDGGPVELVTMTAEEYLSARQKMLENDDC